QPVTVHSGYGEAIINGVLGLPPVYPNNPFVVNHDAAGVFPDLLINAKIIGAGALLKLGPGTLALNGDSTYTGPTYVNEGVLEVDFANALGGHGLNAATYVKNGATLSLADNANITEQISLAGNGVNGMGALQASGTCEVDSPTPALNDFDLST